MKKVRKYRKLLSSLLIFTLILSMGSGVFAAKSAGAFAKEADQYKIYPIPQSVTYGNSSFIMSEDVNVVAEEGIDKYTVNFLKEVLEKNDRTMNLSEDIVSGKTNILLGVKESGGVADTYVADHITRGTADLFEKNDPYLLLIIRKEKFWMFRLRTMLVSHSVDLSKDFMADGIMHPVRV